MFVVCYNSKRAMSVAIHTSWGGANGGILRDYAFQERRTSAVKRDSSSGMQKRL